MGEVYAAYDPELDRRVALKVLRAQVSRSSSSSTARARLLREAKALAKLSHPHVVAIYDVGTVDEQIYIAMEFVKGMTLTKWMRQAPEPLADGTQPKFRPWADVLALFLQAGRGLAAAHKAGIIHRDFKPDNVLIGRDGRVRVVDFGLARADAGHNERPDTFADAIKSLASQTSSVFELRLTRTDGMAGTPAYMAPEQYLNLQVDARTDQFSFCVALYEGLYGERPFRGDTVARVRKAVINGEIADAPKDADVPQWLRTILIRGLSVHPGARYPSMDALLAELSDDPGRPQQSWLRAGLIIIAGLAIAAIGFLELRDKNEGHLIDAEVCAAQAAAVDEAYGPTRRAELEEQLTASSLGDTNQTWRRVDDILSEMTADLKRTTRSICVLDQFIGDSREPFVDLQRACLERRRGALLTFGEALRDLPPEGLANAIPAAHALLGLTPCADPSVLQVRTDEPDDPELAEVTTRLRRDLDRARAKAWLGDLDEALRASRQVTTEAEHADNLAVRAEALLLQGEIEELRGNYDRAEGLLKDALWNAEASRHDEVAIDSLTALVRILGVNLQRHDEAEHLTPRLTAAVRRLGDSRRDARAHHSLGLATAARGHTEAAILRLQNAAATAATIPGPYGRLVGAMINADLGRSLAAAGRFDDAVDAHQRAVDALEATMGTNHPAVAQATVALCETWTAKGELPLALRTCRRALELRGDPSVPRRLRAEARFALAKATYDAKRVDEALTGARRALEEVDGDPAGDALAKQLRDWLRSRSR
jgi:serine/threonine protein kinase